MEPNIIAMLVIGVACLAVGLVLALARSASDSDLYDDIGHLELYNYIDRHDPSLSAELSNLLIRDAYEKLAEEMMLDPPISGTELLSDIRTRLYHRAQELYE